MSMRCSHAARLSLAAVADQATEADLLEVEAHLAACEHCRVDHALLGSVRHLRTWQPDGLSDMAREKVRRNALAAVQESRAPLSTSRPSRWTLLSMTFGMAAAACVLFVILRPNPCRVLGGDIAIVGRPDGKISEGAQLRSLQGGRVLLRGSSVELAAGASATWRDAARTVELEHGSITVEVTPGKGQHFRVATSLFIVEVVGTRFTVTEASVTTEHGKVRVLSTDEKLLATVGAGESWHVPSEPLRPAQKEPSSAPPKVPAMAPTSALLRPRPPSGTAPRKIAARPPDPLGDARRALTQGDADAARAILVSLFHGPRKTAVEARALMAESFLVEGRYGDAMESYRTVVRDFDGTPQAESALYAIAELEVEHSPPDEAARALRRYLSKHPQGRFAKEAHDRLDRLGTRTGK